jgi:hypothetical protein
METETNTRPLVTLRKHTVLAGMLVIESEHANLGVTPAELQAIVQAAYDQHGILASPSYALEAERATERKPGQCPCDTEGCSDRSGDGPDPIREGLQRVFA